ncbi:MAG: NtaA/DmoA family FMN-dependent monooxygenase [Sphingobium sp.]
MPAAVQGIAHDQPSERTQLSGFRIAPRARQPVRDGALTMGFSRNLHLAADLSFAHATFAWRNTGGWEGYPYYGPELYEDMARIASRGVMDLLFFGEAAETPHGYGGTHHAAVKYGLQWPKHDVMPFVPLMARAAPGVSFGITMSTTYHHPFYVARLYNALDHVTGGRIAWNAVTSAYKNEAANWGFDPMMPHDERYERANEHMAVVRKLWDSVEPGAIIMDRETAIFADPDKVHRIDHEGKYFTLPGPLPVMPSPQHHPIIVQAGQSPPGMALCAEHANLQFVRRVTIPSMQKHRAALDEQLVARGRDPRDVGILWAMRVVTNESREEALEKDAAWRESLPKGAGTMLVSSIYGVDFSKLDPTMSVKDAGAAVRQNVVHTGGFDEIFAHADPKLTLDEFGIASTSSLMTVAGTPRQIADQLEEIHEATGQTGGVIISTTGRPVPGYLRDFVEYVVPELQRRGLSKSRYAGPTLRHNFGLIQE